MSSFCSALALLALVVASALVPAPAPAAWDGEIVFTLARPAAEDNPSTQRAAALARTPDARFFAYLHARRTGYLEQDGEYPESWHTGFFGDTTHSVLVTGEGSGPDKAQFAFNVYRADDGSVFCVTSATSWPNAIPVGITIYRFADGVVRDVTPDMPLDAEFGLWSPFERYEVTMKPSWGLERWDGRLFLTARLIQTDRLADGGKSRAEITHPCVLAAPWSPDGFDPLVRKCGDWPVAWLGEEIHFIDRDTPYQDGVDARLFAMKWGVLPEREGSGEGNLHGIPGDCADEENCLDESWAGWSFSRDGDTSDLSLTQYLHHHGFQTYDYRAVKGTNGDVWAVAHHKAESRWYSDPAEWDEVILRRGRRVLNLTPPVLAEGMFYTGDVPQTPEAGEEAENAPPVDDFWGPDPGCEMINHVTAVGEAPPFDLTFELVQRNNVDSYHSTQYLCVAQCAVPFHWREDRYVMGERICKSDEEWWGMTKIPEEGELKVTQHKAAHHNRQRTVSGHICRNGDRLPEDRQSPGFKYRPN